MTDCVHRLSRTERSGRYGGNDLGRGESEWRERGEQDMRRWGEERHSERYDGGERRGSRGSPEVCVLSQTPSDMTCNGSASKTNLIDY